MAHRNTDGDQRDMPPRVKWLVEAVVVPIIIAIIIAWIQHLH